VSTPPEGGSPLVRQWGEYRRAPRRGRRARVAIAAVVVCVTAGVILAVQPWRSARGPHFVSCTFPGGTEARCTTIRVPLDPSRPHGRRIALRVAVLPATRRPAAGALFYLAGGPGVAATDAAPDVNALFAEVQRNRDVVLVDQRGTDGANRLACPADRVRAADAAAVAAYVRRCFAGIGGDVALYTTAAAADDLERVRRALGYGKIDVYGGSYGATLAQVYLRRYPASVRTVVLDGASLLGVPVYERSAWSAQHALDAQLARCAAAPACRTAFPHVRRDLDEVLAQPPRRVTVEAGTFTLTSDDVASTVASLLRSAADAATLPYVVHAAAAGDYVPLARAYAADLGPDLDPRARLATFWVILCSEPWAGFDPAATARDGAGSFLVHAAVARAVVFRRACRSVPHEEDPTGASPAVAAPVLILAGGADPLDPVANLRGWRRLYRNGRLVVARGEGHTVIDDGCTPAVVARFVDRGTARGLAVRCVARSPLPAFTTG
jgi:pimeloyl-ACP methyl ester carboxylesterase